MTNEVQFYMALMQPSPHSSLSIIWGLSQYDLQLLHCTVLKTIVTVSVSDSWNRFKTWRSKCGRSYRPNLKWHHSHFACHWIVMEDREMQLTALPERRGEYGFQPKKAAEFVTRPLLFHFLCIFLWHLTYLYHKFRCMQDRVNINSVTMPHYIHWQRGFQ